MTTRVPEPAYPARNASVLYGDKDLYAKLGEIAEKDGGKTLIEEFEIPIRSGKAWVVKKGKNSGSFCSPFVLNIGVLLQVFSFEVT
jgi:hypothetical protein